ncbi:hypothetical protein [uncultured Thiodictyon sp.]|uniref:hypothetical protein n=1 Tax=uncultured Thiodictyon sp. TaxID=1846217 RepID=UPI0025DBC99E|nr:hypothetical protein [uncultured Thiodictyon sp.]
MYNRQTLRTSLVYSILTALVLAAGSYSATVSATNAPGAQFRYDNSHTATVDIALAATDGGPALLSFYSEGANGLRLLENAFTDGRGSYVGDLRLPAHLNQVVVVVHTAERQETLTLAVTDQSITYTE